MFNDAPPRRRRTRAQIETDEKAWADLLRRHFEEALGTLGNPKFVQSNQLLAAMYRRSDMALSLGAFRRHAERQMGELGYRKVPNEKARDGRWRANGENFYVYARKAVKRVNRETLSEELGWRI